MTENGKGKVVSVNGNLLAVEFDGDVSMNEICYVKVGGAALKSEVIRIRGTTAQVQVYEMTDGIQCGDEVEIRCSGPDEEEALARAVELILSGLGKAGGGQP